MTDIQIVQLLGLAYLSAGLGAIINPQTFKKAARDYMDNLPMIYLTAFLILALGYVLVNRGPMPCIPISLLVTAIGWLALAKGIVILVFPQINIELMKYVKKDSQLSMAGIIMTAIGIALLFISL